MNLRNLTIPFIDTFGIGMDTGSPVSNTYKPPFAFTGTIHEVRVELK